jgi:CheY-like chemotaxis protein
MGNAELLADSLTERPEARELADMTLRAAQRGAELTRSLLAFSRRQALDPRPVDVNRLLAGMDRILRRSIGEDVEVDLVRAPGLWPAQVDRSQLEAAVLNLALNARDAMPDGGELRIETTNTTHDAADAGQDAELLPGQYVLVAVSDTGIGIAPEHLDRVFDPFFTTKPRGRGTGLGLSLVYGFAKQSGGQVTISSEQGSGTTVRIYLPRAVAEQDDAPASQPSAPVGGTETVLLVEDDALVRRFAEETLTSLGYHVIGASNGPAAMAILGTRDDIELLFTDVVMPGGMSGRQLADAALALRPGLRVLYTSGYTENAMVHDGRLDPGLRLLTKPYRRADLARALRAAIEG